MSGVSKIEWTDATWNPVTGCAKVSPGCAHCYAERITERFHGPGSFEKVILHPEKLDEPLHWRKPRHVFVNSMSDLFHEQIPDDFINQVFQVMAQADHHIFQILTKRPHRMREWFNHSVQSWTRYPLPKKIRAMDARGIDREVFEKPLDVRYAPLPNVWLGVSIENQHFADERIPLLLQTPAAVRFVSAEPLLELVTLCQIDPSGTNLAWVNWLHGEDGTDPPIPKLDWVICGGESGPDARPMKPEWARSLRDQCIAEQVPFFFKQWGEWNAEGIRLGKKRSGRLLDGIEWNEYPG